MKDIFIEYREHYPEDNSTKDEIINRLIQVENELNLELPQMYKKFLVEYKGGGSPKLYKFKPDINLGEGKNFSGDDFDSNNFTLSYIRSSKDILETRILNHPALDKLELFTFSHDIADDPICISLAEKNYGKIYSWREDQAPPDEDEEGYEDCEYYDNIYYLCNSFEEFINRLTDSEEI